MEFYGNKAKVPNKSGWAIIKDKSSLYIPIVFDTQREAKREFNDLLSPYSEDHEWRKRLCVSIWPLRNRYKIRNNNNDIYEKEVDAVILREKIRNKIKQGMKIPYGYRVVLSRMELVKDYKEQKIIERILKYRTMGISISGIIEKLKYDRTRNRRKQEFTETQIKKILNKVALSVEKKNESTKRDISSLFDRSEDDKWERIG